MSLSLRIGSAALGWQEFGDAAALGVMTRGMPGGDGSLDFTIPGKTAGERRNVLTPGAEVHLRDGACSWDGLLVGDPLGGHYGRRENLPLAAAGLWSHAARRRDLAYVWVDSDPTQWFRIRARYDSSNPDGMVDLPDQGKFVVDSEGRLRIRGHKDRTYKGYARAAVAYWLAQGLIDAGCRIYALDIIYKTNVPSDWHVAVRSKNGTPWACAYNGTLEFNDTTTRSSWRALADNDGINLTQGSTALVINLHWNNSAAVSPASDPWYNIKSVVVYCRGDVGAVDRAVTLDNAMCDLATLSGLATVTQPVNVGSLIRSTASRGSPSSSRVWGIKP